jgi:hypothetical protein
MEDDMEELIKTLTGIRVELEESATPVVQGYIDRYKGDASRAEKVKKFEEAMKPKDQSLDDMVKNLKK